MKTLVHQINILMLRYHFNVELNWMENDLFRVKIGFSQALIEGFYFFRVSNYSQPIIRNNTRFWYNWLKITQNLGMTSCIKFWKADHCGGGEIRLPEYSPIKIKVCLYCVKWHVKTQLKCVFFSCGKRLRKGC